MKLRTTISLVLSVLWVGSVSAQSPYPDRPVDLRLTGTLLPVEEVTGAIPHEQ